MSRLGAARATAALGAVFWGFFFYGLLDLLVPFDVSVRSDYYLLETGWGVLYFGLVGLPLLCVTFKPRLASPVAQVAIAGAAVAIPAVATPALPQLSPAIGLLLTALLVHALARRSATGLLLTATPCCARRSTTRS